MVLRVKDPAWLREYKRKRAAETLSPLDGQQGAAQAPPDRLDALVSLTTRPTARKYGNKPTWRDGWRFDSQREANCFDYCKGLVAAGEVDYFLRQVPIHLTPAGDHKKRGLVMRVDFLLLTHDGRRPPRWIDAKGVKTVIWSNSADLAQDKFGIKIETW